MLLAAVIFFDVAFFLAVFLAGAFAFALVFEDPFLTAIISSFVNVRFTLSLSRRGQLLTGRPVSSCPRRDRDSVNLTFTKEEIMAVKKGSSKTKAKAKAPAKKTAKKKATSKKITAARSTTPKKHP